MTDLPTDLQQTMDQIQLCADGVDEAPPLNHMGKLMRRLLPIGDYFVWAHRFERCGRPGPWVLIVERHDKWLNGKQISNPEPIFDSRIFPQTMTLRQLCQWFLDELTLLP
jgi:hypothetical protein